MPKTDREKFQNALEHVSDELAMVLDGGELDLDSRERLAFLHRSISEYSTRFIVQPEIRPSGACVESEGEWYETWADHVGSISVLLAVGGTHRTRRVLYDNRKAWLDGLDAAPDNELLAIPGLGPKTLTDIRVALDSYYWRGDPDVSREAWRAIATNLRSTIEYRYVKDERRRRALDGMALVERVLSDEGAPLSDPAAARMIA